MLTSASTDYIQATIELFGAVIILIMGMMLLIITGNKKKSEKDLFSLIMLASASLVFDAGWYICDGSINHVAVVINNISNAALFLVNPLMLSFLCGYLVHLVSENNGKRCMPLVYGINLLNLTTILIVLSNLVYNWMYYIDNHNIYHRMNGWFVYTAVNAASIMLVVVLVLVNSKYIPKGQRNSLFVFILAPIVGIALQSVIDGISFIQIGTAIGCAAILVNYIWNRIIKEKDTQGLTEDRKNYLLIECVLLIMILCVTASVISCILSVNLVSKKNSQQTSTALVYMVSDVVNSNLSEVVNVSRSMARSQVIIDALSVNELEGTEEESQMLEYMQRLKDNYGFETVFVASDRTHAYYTSDGFSRIMDTSRDSQDSWYGSFRNRNSTYALNIDYDKDNEMALCVFVNVAVTDDDGNVIGVCGGAASIESLIDLFSEYEEKYDLDITLMSPDGLVQIDSDRDRIKTTYLSVPVPRYGSATEVYYERNSLQAVMSKYMETLNWYLVVADNQPDKLNVIQIVLPSIVVFAVGISLLLVFVIIFNSHYRKSMNDLYRSRRLSETDGLTGLLNRYSLEQYEDSLAKTGITSPLSVAMVDINGLKMVNDSLGHRAGDELIKGAAAAMINVAGSRGMIYRYGGDEFVIVINCGNSEAEDLMTELKKHVSSWHGSLVDSLSVSTGVSSTDTNPGLSFESLLKDADQKMYLDKKVYYEQLGKAAR